MSIFIVGGGITGATLALAISRLTHGQLPIHLIETQIPNVSNDPNFDVRSIALAQATCQQLAYIDIWEKLADCATAIKTVHVSERGRLGFVCFKALDYHLDALGHVIELHEIRVRLFRLLKENPSIKLSCPATVIEFTRTKEAVSVTLDNGQKLIGQLLVAADGSRSLIGTRCGIMWNQYSYEQAAVVAKVSTSITDSNCAFERFTEKGSLAMLPTLHGESALVWCHSLEKTSKILTWSDKYFCNELQNIFGWRLGRITHISQRLSYPLTLITASQFISHRVVLVGNAAQTLHPIAGQGFNLAMRDIVNLAQIISQAWTEQKDCGTWQILSNYQKRRLADKNHTINITNNLVKLFSSRSLPIIVGRNIGLMIMQSCIPIRNLLARHALGWMSYDTSKQ